MWEVKEKECGERVKSSKQGKIFGLLVQAVGGMNQSTFYFRESFDFTPSILLILHFTPLVSQNYMYLFKAFALLIFRTK